MIAGGLRNWNEATIHVSVPNDAKVRSIPGVRHHLLREIGPTTGAGLRRTRPEVAAIRAAQWAPTDRVAATLIAMTIQQRLTFPAKLLETWNSLPRSTRRETLDAIIRDVCDGAHSLSELDFAAKCRARGMPEPTRQAVCVGDNGRVYLDVFWEEFDVHVEINGAQHNEGTAGIDDALRVNSLTLSDGDVIRLQIPVLGLRTQPDKFLDQVAEALRIGEARRAA